MKEPRAMDPSTEVPDWRAVAPVDVAQSFPVQPLLQVHVPVDPSHDPCPEQPSPGQGLSLLTVVSHAEPVNPVSHAHAPVCALQVPRELQFDGHVLELQSAPVKPVSQVQTPVWVLQLPLLPEQSFGQLFCLRTQFMAFDPVPFSYPAAQVLQSSPV